MSKLTEGFSGRFPSPYDLLRGRLVLTLQRRLLPGELRKVSSRWGSLWQADFSQFKSEGSYQIETDWQISTPFAIHHRIYDRVIAGDLKFLFTQRCGFSASASTMRVILTMPCWISTARPVKATGGWHDAETFASGWPSLFTTSRR